MAHSNPSQVSENQDLTGSRSRSLADKDSDTISVLDFTGVDNTGATDSTVGIQAALDAIGASTLFFPKGTYKITSTLTVHTGQTLRGVGQGVYSLTAGTILRSNTAITMFQIELAARFVKFADMMLSGSDTLGTPIAGSKAVLMQGTTAQLINGVTFDNVGFWRWEKALVGQDTVTRTGSFQISNVHVRDCVFGETKFGVWLDSANADYWLMDNCTGSVTANGSMVWIERGGDIGIRNTTAIGADSTTTTFVTINGGVSPILLERSQAESIGKFLNVTASAGQSLPDFGLIMVGCTVNAAVQVDALMSFTLIGNQFTANFTATNNDKIVDIQNAWATGKDYVLSGNSVLVFAAARGVGGTSLLDQRFSSFAGGVVSGRQTLSFGATVAVDVRGGSQFILSVPNNTNFTISNPTNPHTTAGQRITIQVKNSAGGAMGTITWDTAYKLSAWTNPANGQCRSIDFQYDGSFWLEVGRTAADVPN